MKDNAAPPLTSNTTTVTMTVDNAATMLSPANASPLAGASQTFTWSNAGADSYQLWVGTAPGTHDMSVTTTGRTTANVTGLPANGSTIYVRLYARFGTTWYSNSYTYTSGP